MFVTADGKIACYIDGQLAATGTNNKSFTLGRMTNDDGTKDNKVAYWIDDVDYSYFDGELNLPEISTPVTIKPSVSASSDVIARKNATVLEKRWDYTAYLYSTIDFGYGFETGDFGFDLEYDGDDEDAMILPVIIDENKDKTPEAFAIRIVGNNINRNYAATPYVISNDEKIVGNTVTFKFDENTLEAN